MEDTLQRSTEPEEITGFIAASAIRSPIILPTTSGGGHTPNPSPNAIACCIQQQQQQQQCQHGHHHHYFQQHGIGGVAGGGEDRNVFAIYVSYYVKVKLTLSGMGGELSLKLPFVLVHVDEVLRRQRELMSLGPEALQKLALTDVPAAAKKNEHKNLKRIGSASRGVDSGTDVGIIGEVDGEGALHDTRLDTIESVEDEIHINIPIPTTAATVAVVTESNNTNNGNGNGTKRKLKRSETIAKDFEDTDVDVINEEEEEQPQRGQTTATGTTSNKQQNNLMTSSIEMENVHIVQIHATEAAAPTTTAAGEEHTANIQAETVQPDALPHEPDVMQHIDEHSQHSISVEINADENETGV